jgi:3-hydroxyisobutyrate dehydrogenase-like beta-hydroxyacid dehydrogenase
MTLQPNVGFIGLGDQGAPMAAAIAERFPLHVWARRESSFESLGDVQFARHRTPKDLANAVSVLCLCLRGDADLLQLIDDGLLHALPSGAVLINHATGDPGVARSFAEQCLAAGVEFVDAPVSGGRPGAIARSMTCFVGCLTKTLARCETIIGCHSQHIAHMGPAGTGQAAKLCNNALTVSNLRNIVEVFAIADDFGVEPASLRQAFKHSSGGSSILEALGTKVTRENASHIAKLNRTDVEEFAKAAKRLGRDVHAIEAWALRGAARLEEVVASLTMGKGAKTRK